MNINVESSKRIIGDASQVESLVIDLGGFEGPLHLLLNLAKSQKVDLKKISLVRLADQYLEFIKNLHGLKIEIAADYLIMASWLVFLKSQLLIPTDTEDTDCFTEKFSDNLKFQLLKLEAMRKSATSLMARDQLAKDFFPRGLLETTQLQKETVYKASLIELLQTYASINAKDDFKPLHLKQSFVLTPEKALKTVKEIIEGKLEWASLESLFPASWRRVPKRRRSAAATTLSVILELARIGKVKIRQEKTFAPLYIKYSGTIKEVGNI